MTENDRKEPNWFVRLFRKKANLTYWLDGQAYTTQVCHFKELTPECIMFSDYYTKRNTMVRYHTKITYVLEQTK